MINKIKNNCRPSQTSFSFGATSAIITILGLITGLDTLKQSKLSIIAGILVIALADNISDSLGIHMYQESECLNGREVWFSTCTNFLIRLLVSLTFVLIVSFLPIPLMVLCAVTWGLALLAGMSYVIARNRGVNPFQSIFEHLSIAVIVIIASHFVGRWIIHSF